MTLPSIRQPRFKTTRSYTPPRPPSKHTTTVKTHDHQSCVVVEDSKIGLAAAKAAGMACLVTKSSYTGGEDFSGADAVFDSLEAGGVTLALAAQLLVAKTAAATA